MREDDGMERRHGPLDRWVSFSIRRPWIIITVAGLLFFASAGLASRLGLKSDFVELLPTDAPSVVNLERLKQRVSSFATLTIAIESPDLKASQRFADDLVARLRTFPDDRIRFIDYNLKELRDFYGANKWLYADLPDLEGFRDRLKQRIQEETTEAVFESLDDTPPPKTDLRLDEFTAKYEKKSAEQDRYPNGYYVTPDRKLLAIFVRPPSGASGFDASTRLVDDIQVEIDRLVPSTYNAEMIVGFTGDVKTGMEEREALASDIGFVSILAFLMILTVIILYYRSFRAVLLCGMPATLGTSISLAIAYLSIGHLNTATAFLSAIIIGNGINFMIMLVGRFFEEIRAGGPGGLERALSVSVRGTMKGTAVAALAASIAYGSLVFAGFRGFREFGIIGGVGMVICWVATFATGPALIGVVHRLRPLASRPAGSQRVSGAVGRFVERFPRAILVAGLVVTSISILVSIPYAFDPFEYDFHNLRNRDGVKRGSARLSNKVDRIFELPQSPTPIVADNLEDVQKIQRAILAAPGARATIGDVKTLYDFLPKDQEPKLAVLAELRKLVDGKIDFLGEADRKKVMDYRPPESLRVLTLEDVPEVVARPYAEADGTRGRVLYVYSHPRESLLDGKYLLKFAKFIRGVEVEGASFVAVGQPMVFADMVAAIVHDGVEVSIIAVIGIVVLLIIAFRSGLAVGCVILSVGIGTLWMIGFAAVFDLKLNFLNFVVIPIILGDGVDYGANIFERYRFEGEGRMADIIRSTGGVVVLESLTANLGYASLILSTNMALQSFGILANIGEFTCLAAAEVVMTAFIVWRERSKARAGIFPRPNSDGDASSKMQAPPATGC